MNRIAKGLALMCITFSPLITYANWPIFPVPIATEVSAKIETQGCLLGEGKIPAGTEFPVRVFNQTWYWQYTGTNNCQSLPDDPATINYVSFNETGPYSGDSMTSNYGADKQEGLFRFTLTIPHCSEDKSCVWYCTPVDGGALPNYIQCTYDS